jgi:SAM-dependent methyltransferase
MDVASRRAGIFRHGVKFAVNYRDVPIFAAPGLHELALARLSAVLPPAADVQVLELGAGAGAMTLRLADHGYRMTASDLLEGRFAPAGEIPFIALDLNKPFAQYVQHRFDAVVALEVIEHLENPYHFFRQCREIVADDGHLVVSTPNLANPVSQAMFLRDGDFQWFGDEDYRKQGHIMPILPGVLRRCWSEAGFVCRWEGTVADPARMLHPKQDRAIRWLARLLPAISRTPESLRGEVYMAVLAT